MVRKLAVILGIRPDVIRASLILKQLRSSPECDLHFIWTGQHYSDSLKEIFFWQMEVGPPDVELDAGGETDAEVVSNVIARLAPVLERIRPEAAVFLGDTNTAMGCLAAAQLNIPIVHVEGCMRSYDWRMPEEKYRVAIDHLSDVIYAYFDEYKQQGVAEGLNPESIVVTGNPIVDVLQTYYFEHRDRYEAMASAAFFRERGIERHGYYLMTCHRRENVHDRESLEPVLRLVRAAQRRVYFPASYRTQRVLREGAFEIPANLIVSDPVGYEEFLVLMVNSRGVLTDSGTVVEEACVLQVPSVQMRRSTERPQVYDVGASVKFDPSEAAVYPANDVLARLDGLYGKHWTHPLGDGKASERIAADLLTRLAGEGFRRHGREHVHLDTQRSYRGGA